MGFKRGKKGIKTMGGLFDDIFDDGDFEIAPEEVLELEEDDWGVGPQRQKCATWDTGRKPYIWNADEPWTTSDDSCDDECDPASDCGACQDNTSKQGSFDAYDFFL